MCDLVLYSIRTQEKEVIAHATSEYDFMPREWPVGGNLAYDKYYHNGQPKERLSYSLVAQGLPTGKDSVSALPASGPAMPVYFGTWVIKKHIPTPNVSALSLEQINGYLGQEITVNEKQIVTSQGTIENPVYEESTLTNNDFFINWRIQLNNLGIMDDTVTEINVANYKHETENGLGSGFMLTNDNRLLTNIGGVFFELGYDCRLAFFICLTARA